MTGVAAVAGGQNHSLALKSDGTVWAWGYNTRGQLGDGTNGAGTNKSTPVQVKGAEGIGLLTDATAIDAGVTHSLAVIGGEVWAWGSNGYGQLGDDKDTYTPAQIPGLMLPATDTSSNGGGSTGGTTGDGSDDDTTGDGSGDDDTTGDGATGDGSDDDGGISIVVIAVVAAAAIAGIGAAAWFFFLRPRP